MRASRQASLMEYTGWMQPLNSSSSSSCCISGCVNCRLRNSPICPVTSQRVSFLILRAQNVAAWKNSSWISPVPSERVATNLDLRPRTIPEREILPMSTTFSPTRQFPMGVTFVWSR